MVSLQDKTPPPMGSVQSGLTEGSARAKHTEPGSGHADLEQCISRRMETSPPNGKAKADL